jgi:hypothetical protein
VGQRAGANCDRSQHHRGLKNRETPIKEIKPQLVLGRLKLLPSDVAGDARDGGGRRQQPFGI